MIVKVTQGHEVRQIIQCHVCITMALVCTVAKNTATYFRLFGQKLSIVSKITYVDVFLTFFQNPKLFTLVGYLHYESTI